MHPVDRSLRNSPPHVMLSSSSYNLVLLANTNISISGWAKVTKLGQQGHLLESSSGDAPRQMLIISSPCNQATLTNTYISTSELVMITNFG